MSTFLQLLLKGLETGAIYALASLGIIIVYRTNFMINFAQGTMCPAAAEHDIRGRR